MKGLVLLAICVSVCVGHGIAVLQFPQGHGLGPGAYHAEVGFRPWLVRMSLKAGLVLMGCPMPSPHCSTNPILPLIGSLVTSSDKP